MVERVLIDQNGVKISKPGVNVNVASDIDLLFNAGASTLTRLERGSVVPPNENLITRYFSKSYPAPPFVQFLITDGITGLHAENTFVQQSTGGPWTKCIIYTDRMEIRARPPAQNVTWYYLVWDMPI